MSAAPLNWRIELDRVWDVRSSLVRWLVVDFVGVLLGTRSFPDPRSRTTLSFSIVPRRS